VLCSSADVVVVAAENQLMVFNAVDRQQVSALNFESVVDCVTCSDNGCLLLIGERCGDIHAISARTGEQLASQHLEMTHAIDDESPTFKAIEFGGALSRLVVLTSRGELHVIDGLQTAQLKHQVIDMTTATLCFSILSVGDIVACTDDSCVSLWSSDDGEFSVVSWCPMLFGSAVKCASVSCGHLIVLDVGGHLVLWNVETLVAVSVLSCADVVDFVLVDQPRESSTGTIATLQKTEVSSCVSIYSLPGTRHIYSAHVHASVILFASPVLNDCVYFLEMWTENASVMSAESTSGWQVCRLSETDAQTRLRRLLAKCRFSEAESFAVKFDLDVQLVYRECVSHLVTTLSLSADDNDVDEAITELMKCLGRLNDIPFVVQCCVTTVMPQLAAANQLLSLGHERLNELRCSSAELCASLDIQLQQTSRRLAAFQVTFSFTFTFTIITARLSLSLTVSAV